MSFKPGVYFVRNVKSNTALEMSTVDNKTIYGHAFHGAENQQWEFSRFGVGWSIKCVHGGRYLNIDIEWQVAGGTPTVAQSYPAAWVVRNEQGRGDDVFRLLWPHTKFSIDLDHGTSSNFTKVHIWPENREHYHQLWSLERVRDPDDDTTTLVDDTDPEDRTTITTTTTRSSTATEVTVITTTTVVTRRSGKVNADHECRD